MNPILSTLMNYGFEISMFKVDREVRYGLRVGQDVLVLTPPDEDVTATGIQFLAQCDVKPEKKYEIVTGFDIVDMINDVFADHALGSDWVNFMDNFTRMTGQRAQDDNQ